jgi:acyl carrier protein
MTREEVLTQVQEIFRSVFDDESLNVTWDTAAKDIEDWDSMEHINLIVAMEKTFHVKFNIEEAGSLKNVGEMADLIVKKL